MMNRLSRAGIKKTPSLNGKASFLCAHSRKYRTELVLAVMAAEALLVAQGGLGDEVGRLTAVEQVHEALGKRRMLVEVVQAARKVAQVGKGAAQAALGADDAHIVPHDVADGGPVLCDEGRVVVLLVAGVLPVRDGAEDVLVQLVSIEASRINIASFTGIAAIRQ